MKATTKLRQLLASKEMLVAPGAYDGNLTTEIAVYPAGSVILTFW